jgi:hypothetical protein
MWNLLNSDNKIGQSCEIKWNMDVLSFLGQFVARVILDASFMDTRFTAREFSVCLVDVGDDFEKQRRNLINSERGVVFASVARPTKKKVFLDSRL